MQRQHSDIAQIRGGGNGAGYGIRNIVEFQVEEDLIAEGGNTVNRVRPFGSVKLAANFEKSRRAPQLPAKSQGGAQAVVIGRDDYSP